MTGSLEWLFSELFFSGAPLWDQCMFIAFNIFSCRNLNISSEILIVQVIYNATINELTKMQYYVKTPDYFTDKS